MSDLHQELEELMSQHAAYCDNGITRLIDLNPLNDDEVIDKIVKLFKSHGWTPPKERE